MMNAAFLVGRIANEPVTRTTTTDKQVTTFNLITSAYRNGTEYTETHRIVAWGKGLSTLFTKKLKKGDAVGFIGRIEYDRWEDQGQVKYGTNIVIGQDTEVSVIHRPAKNRQEREPGEEG